MVFYTLWFYNVIKTMDQRKKEVDTFLRKKTEGELLE